MCESKPNVDDASEPEDYNSIPARRKRVAEAIGKLLARKWMKDKGIKSYQELVDEAKALPKD